MADKPKFKWQESRVIQRAELSKLLDDDAFRRDVFNDKVLDGLEKAARCTSRAPANCADYSMDGSVGVGCRSLVGSYFHIDLWDIDPGSTKFA